MPNPMTVRNDLVVFEGSPVYDGNGRGAPHAYNVYFNGGFEIDAGGVVARNTGFAALAYNLEYPVEGISPHGDRCIRIIKVIDGSLDDFHLFNIGAVTLPEAGQWTISADIFIPADWDGGQVYIDTDGGFVGATTINANNPLTKGTWFTIWKTYNVLATDLISAVLFRVTVPPSIGKRFFVDAIQIQKGFVNPRRYADTSAGAAAAFAAQEGDDRYNDYSVVTTSAFWNYMPDSSFEAPGVYSTIGTQNCTVAMNGYVAKYGNTSLQVVGTAATGNLYFWIDVAGIVTLSARIYARLWVYAEQSAVGKTANLWLFEWDDSGPTNVGATSRSVVLAAGWNLFEVGYPVVGPITNRMQALFEITGITATGTRVYVDGLQVTPFQGAWHPPFYRKTYDATPVLQSNAYIRLKNSIVPIVSADQSWGIIRCALLWDSATELANRANIIWRWADFAAPLADVSVYAYNSNILFVMGDTPVGYVAITVPFTWTRGQTVTLAFMWEGVPGTASRRFGLSINGGAVTWTALTHDLSGAVGSDILIAATPGPSDLSPLRVSYVAHGSGKLSTADITMAHSLLSVGLGSSQTGQPADIGKPMADAFSEAAGVRFIWNCGGTPAYYVADHPGPIDGTFETDDAIEGEFSVLSHDGSLRRANVS